MRPVSLFFLVGIRDKERVDCRESTDTSSIGFLRGELVGWIWLDALNDVRGDDKGGNEG